MQESGAKLVGRRIGSGDVLARVPEGDLDASEQMTETPTGLHHYPGADARAADAAQHLVYLARAVLSVEHATGDHRHPGDGGDGRGR